MSRIGKLPINLPSGVKAAVANGQVNIEGPKGKLSYKILPMVTVAVEGNQILVKGDAKVIQASANWGSTRAHLNNMVQGVSKGWTKSLEMNGVGYGATMKSGNIVLSVGFSHEVSIPVPKSVNCKAEKTKIDLDSIDLEALGALAAKIRKVHPPEPYLGKGIKYSDETVRRKAGKTGK